MNKAAIEKIVLEKEKLKTRLKNAKDMALDGDFSSKKFKKTKIEIEETLEKINRDEAKLRQGTENYRFKAEECFNILINIDKCYETSDVETRQKIIGSMFPEKLIFEKNKYRTPKVNEMVLAICRDSKAFKGNKKGKNTFSSDSSLEVVL